jgi:hypothetical protein
VRVHTPQVKSHKPKYGQVAQKEVLQYDDINGQNLAESRQIVGVEVGDMVGSGVGMEVGNMVGSGVGMEVGNTVGSGVGMEVGNTVGSGVGMEVGNMVGSGVGMEVGMKVGYGERVGMEVGIRVGALVGLGHSPSLSILFPPVMLKRVSAVKDKEETSVGT